MVWPRLSINRAARSHACRGTTVEITSVNNPFVECVRCAHPFHARAQSRHIILRRDSNSQRPRCPNCGQGAWHSPMTCGVQLIGTLRPSSDTHLQILEHTIFVPEEP